MAKTDEIKAKETAEISSVTPIELTGTTTIEKVKEITEKLEQGIKDLFESDKFKEYLTTMSKFHNYSFRNTMLILFQKPDASFIAGYGAWQKNFNRQVKKGEKGIKILAPAPYKKTIEETQFDKSGAPMKDKDGNVITSSREITVPAFKVTTVFDLSQTAGDELPQLAKQLTGDIEEYERFFRALKDVSPVPIELETFDRAANGYYHLEEKRIAIRNDLSEMQTIKTAIHEIAHAKLHALPEKDTNDLPEEKRPDNRTREVQAESVAYTVCQHFGIDTSDYSFGYIAGWSSGKETEELKNSLEIIRTAATELITDIENRVAELEKEQQKTQEKPTFDLKSDIHSWYASEFPDDKLGEEIYTGVSFQKLYDMLSSNDVYSIMGVDDSSIRERCFVKLAELMQVDYNVIYNKWLNAEIPIELNPASQPTVTILWSESPHFEAGQKLQLHKADKLFMHLDDNYPEGQGYDKTAFRIDFVMKGVREHYEGRYDIGDKERGLINHIHKYYGFYRTNEQEQGRIAAQGADALAEHNAKCDFILNEFVPYLRFHSNLSVMEDTAMSTMKKKTATAEDKAYCSAVCDYVAACRNEINTAEDKYNFPETPNKADFFIKDNAAEKSKPEKKPSVKKQLAKDKDKKADEPKPKKQTKKKSKELEV